MGDTHPLLLPQPAAIPVAANCRPSSRSGGLTTTGSWISLPAADHVTIKAPTAAQPLGNRVFAAVVDAVNRIESRAYYKPYACVLSDDLFTAVYTPVPNSMVLPADSLPPNLNGPLLRSSTLANGTGLVFLCREIRSKSSWGAKFTPATCREHRTESISFACRSGSCCA